MNKEPTQEQLKKFWEWCGFTFTPHLSSRGSTYKTTEIMNFPDGTGYVVYKGESLELDLNNLFKYAVPKLRDWMMKQNIMSPYIYVVVKTHNKKGVSVDYDTPALALFWAIWEVMP